MSINSKKAPRSISGYIEGLEDAKLVPLGFCDELGYSTFEQASTYAETGKCQLLLLFVSIIGISTTSALSTIFNTNLNVIQCYFGLTYKNKQALNNINCLCLILGGITSSLAADTVSRKWTLIINLVMHAIGCGSITIVTQFKTFLYLRALLSFTITAIIVTHLSEYLLCYYRGSIIACLQIGWLLGVLVIPFTSSLWKHQTLFVVIPSLLCAFLLLPFPDSPRFLFSRGRSKKALHAFQFIFSVNTGKSKREYPIRHLMDNKDPSTLRKHSIVRNYVPPGLEPSFICIPIIMLSQFLLMFSYTTVTLWFPIMNQRLPGIVPLIDDAQIPQDCDRGFIIHKAYIERADTLSIREPKLRQSNISEVIEEETSCGLKMDSTFSKINIITNVITCMPALIFTVLKIDSFGRKFFIMMAHFVAAFLTYASFFMHTSGKDLFYVCIFDSVFIIAVTVAQCLAVEFFPTRLRVFGVALVLAAGTFGINYGANGGIIIYEMACVMLLAVCSIALEFSGLILMKLPDTEGINLR